MKYFLQNLNKFKGFTLAEVMLTLVIMCVVAVVAVPVITANRPSNEKVLLKKAYNTTEQVISELVSNERFYPSDITLKDVDSTNFPNNTAPSGFINYKYPPNDATLEYTIQESFANANKAKGCNCYDMNLPKLTVLFCCSLKTVNKTGNTMCSKKSDNTTECDFETTDGIAWHTKDATTVSNIYKNLSNSIFTITTDVDNKWGGRHLAITSSGYKKTRFVFNVYYDGKIQVDSDAQNILADSISNKKLNY